MVYRINIASLVLLLAIFLGTAVQGEDIDFTAEMVLDTTKTAYDACGVTCTTALTAAVAMECNVGTTDVSNFAVADDGNGKCKVSWGVAVTTTDFTFVEVNAGLVEGQADGTLANTIKVSASLNSATALTSATVSSIVVVSNEPTAAPTQSPTASPTNLTPEHFDYLLETHYIFASILGSIIGLFVIYWGYYGVLYAWNWYEDRLDRIEREMHEKLEAANEKLTKKFHNYVDNPAPHASKMRQNFKRQFGKDANAADGAFRNGNNYGEDSDSDDEERGGKGGGGLQLNKVTVGLATPKMRTPNGRSNGTGVEGGIYSGIRKAGVQAKEPGSDKSKAGSPGKSPSAKLNLSAHARNPSILAVSRGDDEPMSMGDLSSPQAARLRQGGGQRQFGFSSFPPPPP